MSEGILADRRLPGVARGVDATAIGTVKRAVAPDGLLDVIGERRQLLHDRMNSAADVGALEVVQAIMQAKGSSSSSSATPRSDGRLATRCEVSVAHEVGELVARASMHLDGPPPDLPRIVELLVAAVRAIETS